MGVTTLEFSEIGCGGGRRRWGSSGVGLWWSPVVMGRVPWSFGTISAIQGSDTLKQLEEHKRKARAERFGLERSLTADEEAKKKARLSRFGAVPVVPKANAQEEDKKKARALR
ncbi:hypothetical protein RHMOL_Rhmol06G0110600 [Rhododendron molle]|uniref:Uncharacterized protein n=1 Tax=Rhododendron molle TaxID=49168 RepID=A0ACC0NBW0_RHOML|nr:hypothetical protein RHMOL_Rhmol06G0110600 [Rhododendron molle]